MKKNFWQKNWAKKRRKSKRKKDKMSCQYVQIWTEPLMSTEDIVPQKILKGIKSHIKSCSNCRQGRLAKLLK